MIDVGNLKKLALEAKARLDGVSMGPWRAGTTWQYNVFIPYPQGIGPERVLLRMNTAFPHEVDARFIAAAREDVPALADAVLELVAEVARLRAVVVDDSEDATGDQRVGPTNVSTDPLIWLFDSMIRLGAVPPDGIPASEMLNRATFRGVDLESAFGALEYPNATESALKLQSALCGLVGRRDATGRQWLSFHEAGRCRWAVWSPPNGLRRPDVTKVSEDDGACAALERISTAPDEKS